MLELLDFLAEAATGFPRIQPNAIVEVNVERAFLEVHDRNHGITGNFDFGPNRTESRHADNLCFWKDFSLQLHAFGNEIRIAIRFIHLHQASFATLIMRILGD